jgi:hypothetical protein
MPAASSTRCLGQSPGHSCEPSRRNWNRRADTRARRHRRHRRRRARALTARFAPPQKTTDLAELSLPSNIKIAFPEGPDKVMHFEVTILPDEGYYR